MSDCPLCRVVSTRTTNSHYAPPRLAIPPFRSCSCSWTNSDSAMEELEEIVKIAALPLPERPDGIVAVAKYTKASSPDCRSTEAEYERLARANPATIFLRCFAEYENSDLLLGQAEVAVWPTFDLFYQGTAPFSFVQNVKNRIVFYYRLFLFSVSNDDTAFSYSKHATVHSVLCTG